MEHTPEKKIILNARIMAQFRDQSIKLKNWEWPAVMKKLHSLGILTTKAEFVGIANQSVSEFMVSQDLLNRHFNTSKVTAETLPFVWAAATRLWHEFTPDNLSLEDVLVDFHHNPDIHFLDNAQKYADIEKHYGDAAGALDEMLELWQVIIDEIIGAKKTVKYDEAVSWSIRWLDWIDFALSALYVPMQMVLIIEEKLPLEVVNFIDELENIIVDIADNSKMFLNIKMWFALIDGDVAAVDNWVALMLPHIDDEEAAEVFEKLKHWYTQPPTYSATVADPERAMFFERKMLERMDEA